VAEKVNSTALVIVAKASVVGKVKTRLCPPLSFEQAAQLYSGFLLDTVALALQLADCSVKAVCPSPEDATQLSQLLPSVVSYIIQREAGLTDALITAFAKCLAQGYRKVMCISSDNPTLPVAYLKEAVAKLDQSELVLGPSEDGGYYLIGAKAVYPSLFTNMVWSTASVLAETLERTSAAGLTTSLLPLWYDLDTYQELARFQQELSLDQQGAQHTRLALQDLELDSLETGGKIDPA
jgi:rSAM/selenodomain-associated transferase 1